MATFSEMGQGKREYQSAELEISLHGEGSKGGTRSEFQRCLALQF